MSDWTKTQGMPPPGDRAAAARELRLVIQERDERLRKGTSPAGGRDRLRALQKALDCVEYLEVITYHETNGTPVGSNCV